MSLRPIGGIFWRPDASGNLTAYDTSGNILAKFISGNLSSTGNKGTLVSNSPITSTTSLTEVDLGRSINITTQVSSTVLVTINVGGSNSTGGDGGVIAIAVKSGTLNPAGGTADTSPADTLTIGTISAIANATCNLQLTGLVTVTPGAAATLVIRTNATTGGTFSISFIAASAIEI